MTVCVAAICGGGDALIAVADRMLTAGGPTMIEVEHDRPKIEPFTDHNLVMSAGDALIGTDVIAAGKVAVQHAGSEVTTAVAALAKSYSHVRLRVVDQQILGAINYDHKSFQQDGLKQLGPQVYAGLLQQLQAFNLGLELIVAGFDGPKARLAIVTNPGTSRWFDRLGFCSIGSGHNHAMTRLLSTSYSTEVPLEQAVYEVYAAKRNAEVAPGVGQQTDIFIAKAGALSQGSAALLAKLSEVYTERTTSRGRIDGQLVKDLLP